MTEIRKDLIEKPLEMYKVYRNKNTWHADLSFEGKRPRPRLGYYPAMTELMAKEACREHHRKLIAQALGAASNKTFLEMSEEFLYGTIARDRRKTTQDNYEYRLVALNKWFGSYTISAINSKVIDGWYQTARDRMMSPATILTDLTLLGAVFTQISRKWELTMRNPFRDFIKDHKVLAKSPSKDSIIERHEQEVLMKHAFPHIRQMIVFGIEEGMRPNELLSLQFNQIIGNDVKLPVAKSKNKETGYIPITPKAREVLDEIMAERGIVRPDDYVFTYKGRRLRSFTTGFNTAVKKAAEELGDPYFLRITPHDLRRTCGCRLQRELDFSTEAVQGWMRHKNKKTTEDYYIWMGKEKLKKVYDEAVAKRDGIPDIDLTAIYKAAYEAALTKNLPKNPD